MIVALPLVTSAVTSLLGSLAPAAGGQASAAASALQSVQPTATAGGSGDFSSVLSQLSTDAVGKLNKAEQVSAAGITGKATTQSVVEAVVAAQEALQTAVAVRDKAVSSFQEVTRMAI